ncbi:MAG: cell division protein ZapA [Oscillospiraceae bacterium]|nr:cell division protein ZapA [Oscillospiraceae bacterium]
MKNRVQVNIGGQEFVLLTERDEDYVMRVAARTDEEIMGLASKMTKAPAAQIAVLAAVNLAEEALEAVETAESLRAQLKGFLEEASRLKQENADLRRELTRMKKDSGRV